MARIAPLVSIPVLLTELGFDPEATLRETGFRLAEFEDPDNQVSFVAGSQLLALCARKTGCESFGLRLAERIGPSLLGVTGFLLKSAPDVGNALRTLVRFIDLHDTGGTVYVTTSGRACVLGYVIHQEGVEAPEQIYDMSIGTGCNIMRSLCGPQWNPTEVLLSRRAPAGPQPYARFFRAPVRFEADQNALVFPTRWLAQPLASADPLLYRHLEKEAAERQARLQVGAGGKVKAVVRQLLLAQRCSAAEAARLLGMHERTLDRRLAAEGTSFREVVDTMRYDIAKQLLGETSKSLAEIAAALDYADASAFSRAFKRWSGSTPAQWRQHGRRG
jgi:AraC-like DNA-binding protein